LLDSLLKSRTIIRAFKPDVAIGTGGFASGPLLRMAGMAGIPTVLQEQNSFPGITNRWLSKKASKICVAYDNLEQYFPKSKIALTGNPVRQDLVDFKEKRNEALAFFKIDASKKTVLVLGGSLGARRINQLIGAQLVHLKAQNVQLIWQCGTLYFEEYAHYNENDNVQVVPFIDRMDLAYAAADVIISRAGASSVSELCLVGKPTLFIPSPNVAEDHQTKNANAIVSKNGALVIKENELDLHFLTIINDLLNDKELQKQLSENMLQLAKPNATKDIVDEIVKLIKQ
jgi:UDP-N-acetylglucosamine--N-acetylmuramyl-(pentapeptide) pyrophosphoryl-undecaprenol N-acetylglucosamine transferase